MDELTRAEHRSRNRSYRSVAVVDTAAAVLLGAGAVAAAQHKTASDAGTRAPHLGSLTPAQYDTAARFAQHEIDTNPNLADMTLTAAPATVIAEKQEGNRAPCPPTVIRVFLVGRFPHVITSGVRGQSGPPPPDSYVLYDLDPDSGQACLSGVGDNVPAYDPDAADLLPQLDVASPSPEPAR